MLLCTTSAKPSRVHLSLSCSVTLLQALDNSKRKKKGGSSKSRDEGAPAKPSKASKEDQAAQLERAIFSQPATATVSNWADTDDEDGFDQNFSAVPPSWLQVRWLQARALPVADVHTDVRVCMAGTAPADWRRGQSAAGGSRVRGGALCCSPLRER